MSSCRVVFSNCRRVDLFFEKSEVTVFLLIRTVTRWVVGGTVGRGSAVRVRVVTVIHVSLPITAVVPPREVMHPVRKRRNRPVEGSAKAQ